MAGILKVDRVQSDSNLAFQIGSSNVAYFNTTGLNITGGEIIAGGSTLRTSGGMLYANSGIAFPGTHVASADPNTLDDYEEGTWTPTTISLNNISSITISYASYIKVGRLVHCSMYGTAAVTSTSTNTYFGFSLPFVAVNNTVAPSGTFNFAGATNNLGTVIDWSGSTNDYFGIWVPSANMLNNGTLSWQLGFTYPTVS